jgi:hypothetical protein
MNELQAETVLKLPRVASTNLKAAHAFTEGTFFLGTVYNHQKFKTEYKV